MGTWLGMTPYMPSPPGRITISTLADSYSALLGTVKVNSKPPAPAAASASAWRTPEAWRPRAAGARVRRLEAAARRLLGSMRRIDRASIAANAFFSERRLLGSEGLWLSQGEAFVRVLLYFCGGAGGAPWGHRKRCSRVFAPGGLLIASASGLVWRRGGSESAPQPHEEYHTWRPRAPRSSCRPF